MDLKVPLDFKLSFPAEQRLRSCTPSLKVQSQIDDANVQGVGVKIQCYVRVGALK